MADVKKKTKELISELERDIKGLEKELANKKELMSVLQKVGGAGVPKTRRGRRGITSTSTKTARGRKSSRRKSRNRDIILEAAGNMSGKFKLAELLDEINKINPRFGGKHPAGAVLAVLKTTPEIKKVKRGWYRYR